MKYLIITTKHHSALGDRFCTFWGIGESPKGFTPDVRLAHRFAENELPMAELKQMGTFAIPCSGLGVPEDYSTANPNTCEVVELAVVLEILRDLP